MNNHTNNHMTPEGLEALRKEVEHLKTVDRREIAQRIKTAREWGDLKENAEYHDAKNTQGLLERKIKMLDERLRNAVAVEIDQNADSATIGSTVEIEDEQGKNVNYRLVGSTEADPSNGKLSSESPIGQQLLGSRSGDVVAIETPTGTRKLKVVSISF